MHLEGTWPVYQDDLEVGQCRFTRRGLYWDILCRCTVNDPQIYRLALLAEDLRVSLGIPIPEDGQRVLHRTLAAKTLAVPENFRLELVTLDQWQTLLSDPSALIGHRPPDNEMPDVPLSPAPVPDTQAEEVHPGNDEPTPAEADEQAADEVAADTQETIPAETMEEPVPATAPDPNSTPELPQPLEEVPDTQPLEAVLIQPETLPPETEEAVSTPPELPPQTEPSPVSTTKTSETSGDGCLPADQDSAPQDLPPESVETDLCQPNANPCGTPYDPAQPLPPLDNWASLRAVRQDDGTIRIHTSE